MCYGDHFTSARHFDSVFGTLAVEHVLAGRLIEQSIDGWVKYGTIAEA